MYTLTTMVEFSSAHTLVGHSGPCKKMHGHNWKVEVEITGEKLDKIGMVVDFKEIRKATNLVVDELDHEFLNNLEPFSEDNPTAENIARYIFTKLSEEFSNKNVKVNSIKLWETDKSAVSYKE
ncbi:MAG: 6-carboxytetrahydropterin synthase QueD [Pseudomonadota bacterium]|jgi:6-pyruvoyltetrahydropterin/6-carboxytetrahydropterin synthase|nr:6-carboxytetrahydropterin synthase QueD [Gammaproteobacteria bacterium]MEC7677373.1 6-carboxytetrahydropterin synthase QueD [Pseudomonadota bacterium]MEC8085894.1 6-carboxytetrahydropterin synthase QueD [Pseudomonadota bacterium]MEC8170195.1 6-carboxytetrahydropterin synthase QueD [Pseudomonadota bacterium]GIR56346.1 MAG: 6-carboxy-5,6,7,8-tetrahydropterin synthase [Gammaproteobacteria bacterium]|tara:strand:- start:6565 stop:6933 length:369 start_codon:yes stop_codon:yes gene_type:complete